MLIFILAIIFAILFIYFIGFVAIFIYICRCKKQTTEQVLKLTKTIYINKLKKGGK